MDENPYKAPIVLDAAHKSKPGHPRSRLLGVAAFAIVGGIVGFICGAIIGDQFTNVVATGVQLGDFNRRNDQTTIFMFSAVAIGAIFGVLTFEALIRPNLSRR